jgi:hypothetical protein
MLGICTRIILTKLVNWILNLLSLHRSGRLHRLGGLIDLRDFRLSVFRSGGLSDSRDFRLSVFRSSGLNGLRDFRLNVFRSDGSDESIYTNFYNFHSPCIPTHDVLKG